MSDNFYEVPSKEQWERREYLEGRRRLAEYNKKPLPDNNIFCTHCKKAISDFVINVVQFGKAVACRTCYTKRYAKLKVRWAKFEYPPDLVPKAPDETELKQAEKECLDLQNAECDRIKNEGKDQAST